MEDENNDPAPVPGTIAVKTKDGGTAYVVPLGADLHAAAPRVKREDEDYAAVERPRFRRSLLRSTDTT